MTVRQKKLIYIAVGVAISVVLLWALFRNIDFVRLRQALRGANYWWLLPNVLLVLVTMYQRAYRWRFMLLPIKKVPMSKLMAATCIGFMANNVLPLRLGEFVRAYSLADQDKDISKSASLATIFVERMVFDLVALLLIFGGVLMVTSLHIDPKVRTGIYVAISIALLGIVFMYTLALRPQRAAKLIVRYLFFVPVRIRERVQEIVLKFSRGLEFVTDIKTFLWVSVQTMLIWIIMGLSNYFVFLAFGFDLPVSASFMLLVIVSIAILIPSSPGFIGVYHYAAAATLQAYSISSEKAVSFALVLHAAQNRHHPHPPPHLLRACAATDGPFSGSKS
ncbi:MAG: UPF0104 family protein, partial [Candidatus Zixiibacteriota bacterium]